MKTIKIGPIRIERSSHRNRAWRKNHGSIVFQQVKPNWCKLYFYKWLIEYIVYSS